MSKMSRMFTGCPGAVWFGLIWNLSSMNCPMSSLIASLFVRSFLFCVCHSLKSLINFFSTLLMWRPEPQMVRAGKGTSVTNLVVFFRVVTTCQNTSQSGYCWFCGLFKNYIVCYICTGSNIFPHIQLTTLFLKRQIGGKILNFGNSISYFFWDTLLDVSLNCYSPQKYCQVNFELGYVS